MELFCFDDPVVLKYQRHGNRHQVVTAECLPDTDPVVAKAIQKYEQLQAGLQVQNPTPDKRKAAQKKVSEFRANKMFPVLCTKLTGPGVRDEKGNLVPIASVKRLAGSRAVPRTRSGCVTVSVAHSGRRGDSGKVRRAVRAAHTLADMKNMPDCQADGCQWKKEVWCDRCPLRTEKYLARVAEASHPLYRIAAGYLHRKKLGLTRWEDYPGVKVARAVEIVDGERNRIQAEKIDANETKKRPQR